MKIINTLKKILISTGFDLSILIRKFINKIQYKILIYRTIFIIKYLKNFNFYVWETSKYFLDEQITISNPPEPNSPINIIIICVITGIVIYRLHNNYTFTGTSITRVKLNELNDSSVVEDFCEYSDTAL